MGATIDSERITMQQLQSITAFDQKHLWHPYARVPADYPLFEVVSAEGPYLHLADGRRLIDGMASWWSAIHGYNHPALNRAVEKQLKRMAHVMFGGLTHEPAVQLGQRLVDLTPAALDKVFLADSGSISVEVAVKMAIQYQQGKGRTKRQKLATVRGGYHGDTTGAMAVCDPVNGMHTLFRNYLPIHFFADRPGVGFYDAWDRRDFESMAQLVAAHHEEIAGVILEPIVQGTGGMRFYHPQYLRELRALCDAHDMLLIFDEIATNFGRSGKLFALEHAGVVPDILCLGKAMSGGYMTLAATMTSAAVADVINQTGALMHGPTFMGNPLACSVAVASIDQLISQDWQARIRSIEAGLLQGLGACRTLQGVADVRVMGAIGVVELEEPVDMAIIQPRFVEAGVWVRPFGKLVYVMPPYILNESQLAELCAAIVSVLQAYTR
jgi:adenosylmethionine-8-amino-7-oxononanoate aminotransferase